MLNEEMLKIVKNLNIPDIQTHLFLCADPHKAVCSNSESAKISWTYLKNRIKELKLDKEKGVYRSLTHCLRICVKGPILLVYPEKTWYHSCTPEVIEKILQEHIIEGNPVKEYLIPTDHNTIQ